MIQRVLDALPGPIAYLCPVRDGAGTVTDFVIHAASPEAADLTGRRGAQLVGVPLAAAYASVDPALFTAYRQVLATGQAQLAGPFTDPAPGPGPTTPSASRYSVRVHRLGDGLVITWVLHDRDNRQAERIARTESLGNLGWGEWDLVSGRVEWSEQLYRIYGRDPADGPMSNAEADALTVPEDHSVLAEATRTFEGGGRFDALYRIRVDGDVKYLRGVIDAVRDSRGQPLKIYGIIQDVTVRETAKARLAEVERQLDERQRSLDAEHRLAAQLQHIILPIPRMPIELPGMRVALRYLPAGSLNRVGGDWYHAAALADGRILLAVGDVAGHGLPAATTMALLRHALRALTVITSEPAGLMSGLNRLLCDQADDLSASTATAVIARYDPSDRTLVWAQAGHPAPLLTRDGVTGPLARPPGALLGVVEGTVYDSASTVLAGSDMLLLYTDGLIENRVQTIQEGQQVVISTVDSAVASSPDQPLTALIGRLRRANRHDDTCILAAAPADVAVAGAAAGGGRR